MAPEVQRRARRRAAEMGISFSEYVRRLVVRDVGEISGRAEPTAAFDLGDSGGSDVSRAKDEMVGRSGGSGEAPTSAIPPTRVSVFVDSSAWYAAADRSDRLNGRAKEILSQAGPLVTSDHVLMETWLLVRVMQRLGLREAASFDDHFAVYRFGPGRRQSFVVLR